MLQVVLLITLIYCFVHLLTTIHKIGGGVKHDEAAMKQSLEFVHITKTGGTAIVEKAATKGVRWGACHYGIGSSLKKFGVCSNKDLNPRRFGSKVNSDLMELPEEIKEARFRFLPWHTPPHWFKENPLAGSETFAIIRNPYDRAVSEYYSKWGANYESYYKVPGCENSPQVMNDWIQQKARGCLSSNGHFLPQHYYIYNNKGQKVVNHILRYENLDEDFSKLMKNYSLNITLGKEHVRDKECTLTADDLSKETIDIINTIYSEDFSLLGYPKRSTKL